MYRGDEMRLIGKYFKMSLQRQLQYRLNFLIACVSIGPIHLIQLVFSWFIAKEFDGFGTWESWNLIFLYGLMLTSYGIAQVFARNLRYLEDFVITGNLDIYFTKPQPILFGLVFHNLGVIEIFAHFFPSVAVLVAACICNRVHWSLYKLLVLLGAVIGGAFIQMALFLLIGSVSFWTMKSRSLEKIFYAFKDFLNYPLYVYGKEVLAFLTYVLPLAFINYYPSLYILDKEGSMDILNFMTIPVALLLSGIVLLIWKISLAHYNSAGN